MDDEDGRCLLDVICDPEALNDFLHGSETHLDTDDLLDGSSDPSSSFFSTSGGHMPEVQPTLQLSATEPTGLSRVSVDLDFLEDDDILGGSPGGEGGSNGIGTNHEPCDILQQSLAEANITEQSLQEAEAELDLGSFGIPGLTQVVQTLPDASLSATGGTTVGVGIGVGVGGATTIFPGSSASTTVNPPNATADMLGSVLAQQGLQLQPQVINKAISVQPFMQPVGLGNVTLQPISSLQALPNGGQSGHLGIGQIQVVGQPTVMTINQSGQSILAKAMGGYQLHQSGPEVSGAGAQTGIGGSGSGLLIQGNKATLGSPALNGPAVCVSSTNTSGGTMTAPAGLVGFGSTPLSSGIGPQTQTQGQIMQNVIIQRTPTPIQPKPPQGGAIQPKLFKPHQQQQPASQSLQNDAHKALGLQQLPVSGAQNVAFLTGKPGSNVVLSTQTTTQGPQLQQTLFKPQAAQPSGKPLSVHLLNQPGSIVIPSQTVLQGQNHQFLLPQLQAGGQILTQHPGGHIITSQGPGGQIIANQILTANQNINLSQVLTSQGHTGAAHILSAPIQLQPGQMATPTLFQMPVSLAQSQTQTQSHTVSGHAQTVIQGMPIQNSVTMLGQVEGLSPAVSLQPALQPSAGGVPSSSSNTNNGTVTMAQGQSGECVTMMGTSSEQAAHPTQQHGQQPSILTMQPAPVVSTASSVCSSVPSMSVSTSSSVTAVGLVPPQAQHSPGRLLFTNQGSSMILSQESLQMFLQQSCQEQHLETEDASTPSVGIPASVIVSSNSVTAPAPSVYDKKLADSSVDQGHSPSPGPSHITVVQQVPASGHQQPLKIQGMSPSPALPAHATAAPVADSPQPSQSPITLNQQIQSPHPQQQSRPPSQPQPQSQTPSRSCTPSSHPPLFIVHNQITESPQANVQSQPQQTQSQQALIQAPLQPQTRQASQPACFPQEMPPMSQSPKPPPAPPAQHQFTVPPVSSSASTLVKAQIAIQGLTGDQQHHLQLVAAQIQTLSAIAQPSPQQKQLLDKLHQVQQNILMQAKQPQSQPQSQPPPTSQFTSQQDVPVEKVVVMSSASAGAPAQLSPVLQQASLLIQTPATGSSDLQVFSGAPGPGGAMMNQTVTPASLTQPTQVQPKSGVISSVGGMGLGKGGVQIQVLGSGLTPVPAAQPPAPLQTQTSTIKMPFSAEPSKEARMLEQLRKQQGSVLHPNYSAPFHSFEDTLHRLLPYHLYQGTANSSQDYQRVDEEFERVSCHLLKRTQAMLDKYRYLLFAESKQRLGPSAEMVMIDRMFIQEEKVALSQDKILAKERPEEFMANARMMESVAASFKQKSSSLDPTLVSDGVGTATPAPTAPTPVPNITPSLSPASAPTPAANPVPSTGAFTTPFPSTKLVIKQGGGGASVSWSSSCPSAPATGSRLVAEPASQSSSFSRAPTSSTSYSSTTFSSNTQAAEDDDALPQRTSKPPIKTYEARRRIGLKLKIKQDQTGFSKVVHNTALDPVHAPQPQPSSQSTSQSHTQSEVALQCPKADPVSPPSVIRTQSPVCTVASSSSVTIASTQSNPPLRGTSPHKSTQSSSTSSSHTWSSSTSSSMQMNGTLEHHEVGGVKRSLASTPTPPQTTCRLPLRKTYRENISPRIRPGVPGGGDESLSYPRATPSPPRHEASSPSSDRTVIASMKVEKRGREISCPLTESCNEGDHLGGAMQGLDQEAEVFNRGIKTSHQHHLPQLLDREGAKDRGEDHADQETEVGNYRRSSGKKRQGAGGTFRMDQHAPGPPSPESTFIRDSLLSAKRCKSDSPDMDNASFSSGSPPDDSLSENLQCAIDSILNLQQEPSVRPHHNKGGSSRTLQHQSQRTGGSAISSNRSSVPPSTSSAAPSSSSLAQRPQVGGRGHNGSLVPQTQSR
ncbi:BRD4-interacting chromatin-remodeling complex-associated protein isoform X2 [Thalassophryne amazonica]|uniref:BRD4-interacting chromatin-remodeling complex-associated protein isoform X2 n=1 Tax=Thalassophryne amazonica TaxID=390379 RepID=UPI00147119C3|nr:BRD4-interacting chromatin-remodeling complex-associated protein isoform X2 [Thalassophryne amazonica]